MSDDGARRPMGFYPDPDVPGERRFWDGTQWRASLPTYDRPGVGEGFGRLAATLVAVLALHAVVILGFLLLQVGVVSAGIEAGSPEHLRYGVLSLALLGALILLWLGAAVPWCIWQYRLAEVADGDQLRRTPLMHILSWFLPIVGYWWPAQNVRDLGTAARVRYSTPLVGAWWTGYLLTGITGVFAGALLDDVVSAGSLRSFAIACLVSAVLGLITVLLAIAIVLRLTRAAVEDPPSGSPAAR